MNIRVAIVGPTGYTGLHLIELLLRHPNAAVTYLASRRQTPVNVVQEFAQLRGRLPDDVAVCRAIDVRAIAGESDVVFTCLPHVVAMQVVPTLLDAGLRVVDLSADYRFSDARVYEQTYHHEHSDLQNLSCAAYGLPELFREALSGAQLVANPGCYPTATALGVAPLVRSGMVRAKGMIVNAASGVTGAGRKAQLGRQFAEHNESFYAYGVIGGHRHQPEIVQVLSRVADQEVDVLFVPHLLPIDRGILATVYLDPVDDGITQEAVFEAFEAAYEDEPFVRVCDDPPNVKHVQGTNYCDISARVVVTGSGRKVVVFSTIDNMIKGASGQAVQNMNLMFDQDETSGLV